jgi:hypothetical protein
MGPAGAWNRVLAPVFPAPPADSVRPVSIRDEVRASTAAHRDLGPGYDAAVAEGLVERIGEEIDRRVDARLYGQVPYQAPPPRPRLRREPVPGRMGFGAVVLALGSMGMAIGATAAVLHPGDNPPGQVSGGATVLIALIWIVIGIVNVAYARYRQLSAAYLWLPPARCSVRS